jgi:hypothetical protein
LRKIPVKRRKISRAECRGKFSLKTGIFRNLLESVQVEASRIITGLRINSSKSKLYEELGWELLYKRREKHKLILMYKIINGHTPNYLSDLVQAYALFHILL